jgi:hypothetical protein
MLMPPIMALTKKRGPMAGEAQRLDIFSGKSRNRAPRDD